jgi:hypothetical protein
MTAYALPKMPDNTLQRIWWYFVAVPWRGLGLYSPQALLALPAAYASSQFAAHYDVFPAPFNYMLGVAFEWVYLGTLAVAGAQKKNHWYIVVNGVAVVTSICYVTLHAANQYQLFGNPSIAMLWFFAVMHGVPLAGLNFFYGLLVHSHLKNMAEEEAQTAHKCETCGQGFKSPAALNGHRKGCKPGATA